MSNHYVLLMFINLFLEGYDLSCRFCPISSYSVAAVGDVVALGWFGRARLLFSRSDRCNWS